MRKSLWMGALVLVAAAAFAAAGSKESAKVKIPYQVSWAGAVLPAGHYTFQWQEQGDGLDVTIMRGSEVMAKGRGRLTQQPTKSDYNAVGTERDDSGSRVLTRVFFRGKTEILVLGQS